MKMKILPLGKIGLAMICGLLAFASCSKEEKEGDKTPEKPAYLPVLISDPNRIIDSLVWNDRHQLTRIYTYKKDGVYSNRYYFSYDEQGRCVHVDRFNMPDGPPAAEDTLVYVDGKVIVYPDYMYYGTPNFEYAIDHKFSPDGLTLWGTKDTVDANDRRNVYYIEYLYSAGNVSSIRSHYYDNDFSSVDSSGYTCKYTYDDKPNGMQWLFKQNAYAAWMLNEQVYNYPVLGAGPNNVTGLKLSKFSDDDVETADLVFNNTYDPVTGFLSTLAWTSTGIVDSYSLKFQYEAVK